MVKNERNFREIYLLDDFYKEHKERPKTTELDPQKTVQNTYNPGDWEKNINQLNALRLEPEPRPEPDKTWKNRIKYSLLAGLTLQLVHQLRKPDAKLGTCLTRIVLPCALVGITGSWLFEVYQDELKELKSSILKENK